MLGEKFLFLICEEPEQWEEIWVGVTFEEGKR
jgi:hypothetical protein